MDTEKIISTILQKAGKTDVTSKTLLPIIEMNPLPEGQEPDDAYFDKMVGVVKTIQGNLNHTFASKLQSEVDAKVEEAKKKLKAEPSTDPDKNKKDGDGGKPNEDDRVAALEKKIADMEAAQAAAKKQSEIESVRNSVKNGLIQKFDEAGLKVNKFFLDTAMSKMEIPEENADVESLVKTVEAQYQADVKAAGIEYARPHAGGRSSAGREVSSKDEFADVAKMVNPGMSQS